MTIGHLSTRLFAGMLLLGVLGAARDCDAARAIDRDIEAELAQQRMLPL